jgi:hypothetical protein
MTMTILHLWRLNSVKHFATEAGHAAVAHWSVSNRNWADSQPLLPKTGLVGIGLLRTGLQYVLPT